MVPLGLRKMNTPGSVGSGGCACLWRVKKRIAGLAASGNGKKREWALGSERLAAAARQEWFMACAAALRIHLDRSTD
jgi:hypothetical protein